MFNGIKELDLALCAIMRSMWTYLLFCTLCVFGLVCTMYVCPTLAINAYRTVPLMLEHLLAGCTVTVGLGVLFQYLGG